MSPIDHAANLFADRPRAVFTGTDGITWSYATLLNVAFLLVAVVLVRLLATTGGVDNMAGHDHAQHSGHSQHLGGPQRACQRIRGLCPARAHGVILP